MKIVYASPKPPWCLKPIVMVFLNKVLLLFNLIGKVNSSKDIDAMKMLKIIISTRVAL